MVQCAQLIPYRQTRRLAAQSRNHGAGSMASEIGRRVHRRLMSEATQKGKPKRDGKKKTASRLEVGEHAARAFGSVEEQTTAVFSSANAQFIPFFFFLFCCIRFCELTRGINARLQWMRRFSDVETFVDYF